MDSPDVRKVRMFKISLDCTKHFGVPIELSCAFLVCLIVFAMFFPLFLIPPKYAIYFPILNLLMLAVGFRAIASAGRNIILFYFLSQFLALLGVGIAAFLFDKTHFDMFSTDGPLCFPNYPPSRSWCIPSHSFLIYCYAVSLLFLIIWIVFSFTFCKLYYFKKGYKELVFFDEKKSPEVDIELQVEPQRPRVPSGMPPNYEPPVTEPLSNTELTDLSKFGQSVSLLDNQFE